MRRLSSVLFVLLSIVGLTLSAQAQQVGPAGKRDSGFHLEQNYPNPFNPETKVRFALPETGRVKVTVFDMTGRKVTTLVDGVRETGIHSLLWDGKDGFGKPLPSGIFVCRVKFGDRLLTRKMTLIR